MAMGHVTRFTSAPGPPGAFTPAFPLRNPHLQTILASLKIRAWGENPLR